MVIRCERCSTMYELDESLLAPTGSEVQCTKCQHVFTAYPPHSAGRTLVGVPAQQPVPPSTAPAAPSAPSAPPSAAPPPPTAPAAPAVAAAPAPSAPPRTDGGVAAPRPVSTRTPAVYRPQTSPGAAGAAVPRAPVLKRDTVGTFEARLRWSARVRWLVPLAAACLVVLVLAMWALLRRRGDAGAERTRVEAVALLSLDDAASVDEAVSRLGAVVNRRPKLRDVAADRALALVVRAALTAEDGEGLTARVADLREERERARRDEGAGWQEHERAASAEVSRLDPEIRAREEKMRALSSGARDQLTILQAEVGETPEVLRALAMLHALTGERDRLQRDVRSARERGVRDPWIDLADGWADARDPERAARERALVKLGALAAARPELLRGRYLLARAQLSLGRKVEARATTDAVLGANPAHEGAKRLRDELARPPQAPPAPAPQAAAAPPEPPAGGAEKPAPRRRKTVSAPVDAPSPDASAAPAPAAAPAPEPAPAAPAEDPASAPAQPLPAAVPAPPAPPPAPRRRDPAQPAARGDSG